MQEGSGMLQTTVSTTTVGDPLLAALAGGIRMPQQVLQEVAPQFPDRFPTDPGAVNILLQSTVISRLLRYGKHQWPWTVSCHYPLRQI